MARKLVVEIVGDASSFEKALKTSAAGTGKFTREMSKTGTTATKTFRGLGKTLVAASGGFVAFQGVSSLLKDSVNAAQEAAVSQKSLAAQMKAAGESFQANRQRIEDVANSYAKFGFNSDQVEESLTILERGTGNLNEALRVQGLTADISAAKTHDLGAAAAVVAKVFGGQETALRRAVPGLDKTAHGWDLIRLAQQKMAGQAKAHTTALKQFNAALFDSEKIIGRALLPIINKYLRELSDWLTRMNRSGQLQRDVTEATRVLSDALRVATDVVGVLRGAFHDLNRITGSTRHSLELLFGALVAFKTLKLAATLASIASDIGLIGANARTSARGVSLLSRALRVAAVAAPEVAVAGAVLSAGGAQGGPSSTARGGESRVRRFVVGGAGSRDPRFVSWFQRWVAAHPRERQMTVGQIWNTDAAFRGAVAHWMAVQPRPAGVTINGGVHLHGVQDVKGLENELQKRHKARAHNRRGAR